MIWKKFISYLTFWKKPVDEQNSTLNLKVMHGINKLSILMFLVALIIIAIRLLRS